MTKRKKKQNLESIQSFETPKIGKNDASWLENCWIPILESALNQARALLKKLKGGDEA